MVQKKEQVNKKQSTRIGYIDVFRGFGILFMIMGHIGYGNEFDTFIHAFHMPMFFWISGYLFNHKTKEEISFRSIVKRKTKSLLLPYFIFGITHYLLWIIGKLLTHQEVDAFPLLHLFSINTSGLPICGALWFLTALFFTDIIFFLIDRYILNGALKTIIVVTISLIGNLANEIFPVTLPFALGASFVGIGLYYLGYLCKKYSDQTVIHFIINLSWIPNIILGAVTTISIFANGYTNMRLGLYSIIPLFWINAMLSIIVGINFAKLIYPHIQNNPIGKLLICIGRDSIVYVCLNEIVILIIKEGLNIVGVYGVISKVLTLIIALVALFIINRIIAKSKLRVLIGRN